MDVSKIFRDTSYPEITYIERDNGDKEEILSDELFKESIVVSISGPSKTGKSALVEHVKQNVERVPDEVVEVRGNNIHSADQFWQRVLKQLGEPTHRREESRTGTKSTDRFDIGAAIEALTAKYSTSETEEDFDVIVEEHDLGLEAVLEIYSKGEFIIFVDDAHKIPKNVHNPVAEKIKEGLDKGLKFCVGYIDYRSDALTASDIDLSARVESISLEPWEEQELRKIAHKGFEKLDIDVNTEIINTLARESIHSPQLMQKLCYNICMDNNVYYTDNDVGNIDINKTEIKEMFKRVGESLKQNYTTELDLISGAAKGKSSKQYEWVDGNSGDRYDTVLRGIAANPPKTSFELEEVKDRIYEQCSSESPQSGNITNDIKRMSDWIDDSDKAEDFVFDYLEDREEQVQAPEPALIFCLRWSNVIDFEPDI